MIQYIQAYKTDDGKIFTDYHEAKEHDSLLSYKQKNKHLNELHSEQTKDKQLIRRTWWNTKSRKEALSEIQQRIDQRKCLINELSKELNKFSRSIVL